MKHLDTFSGYGGFTLAAQKETVGFSEIEPHAIAVLKYHYPEIKNYGDISQITELPDFDLLTGGTPCQDLSVAGRQAGLSGARSGLFFQFIRLLKEKQPANFIWENVKGALSSSDGWDFARVQIEMAEAGYAIQWQVLNAKYFGVPQSRDRVFVIGSLGGECRREVFFEQTDPVNDIKVVGNLNSDTWIKRFENIRRVHHPTGLAPTTPTGTGGGVMTKIFIDLSTQESKVTDTARTIQARYNKGYSHRKGETSGVYDGYRIRRLTPLECERLMGLPDNWTKYGMNAKGQYELSDSARYKLCGNGVVVNVVKELIKHI
jgi:DNA (cytosine-5)-methyltransferase 1